jgi:hypothetical protein
MATLAGSVVVPEVIGRVILLQKSTPIIASITRRFRLRSLSGELRDVLDAFLPATPATGVSVAARHASRMS